jgi:site-specific recombinase XerD
MAVSTQERPPFPLYGVSKKEIFMSAINAQDQGIILLSQEEYLSIAIESFLIDCRLQGLSPHTTDFYTKKLKYFITYCEGQAVTQISQITTEFIRRYILQLSETHNAGGVRACFRPLRTLLYWIEAEEIMPPGWKNPIRRVKAPRIPTEPIEPIHIEDVNLLLKTCENNYVGVRDKAIILALLDTGARAMEFLNINVEDIELPTGAVLSQKQPKTKTVFWLLCAIEAQVSFALSRLSQAPHSLSFLPFPRPGGTNFHLNFSLSSLNFNLELCSIFSPQIQILFAES